jgi:hypothetical protein
LHRGDMQEKKPDIMKGVLNHFTIIVIAVIMMAGLAACGSDDDPGQTVVYPTVTTYQKRISKITKAYDNGANTVITATCDNSAHLVSAKAVETDNAGTVVNASLSIDYKSATMTCVKGSTTKKFTFAVNAKGYITKLKATGDSVICTYNADGTIATLDFTNEGVLYKTVYTWESGNVKNFNIKYAPTNYYQVSFSYGSYANKGNIDVTGMRSMSIDDNLISILRSYCFFGVNSAMIPSANYPEGGNGQSSWEVAMPMRVVLNSDGYISKLSGLEYQSCTATYEYY